MNDETHFKDKNKPVIFFSSTNLLKNIHFLYLERLGFRLIAPTYPILKLKCYNLRPGEGSKDKDVKQAEEDI